MKAAKTLNKLVIGRLAVNSKQERRCFMYTSLSQCFSNEGEKRGRAVYYAPTNLEFMKNVRKEAVPVKPSDSLCKIYPRKELFPLYIKQKLLPYGPFLVHLKLCVALCGRWS